MKFFLHSILLLFFAVLGSGVLRAQCAGTPGLELYWVGTSANGSGDYSDTLAWRVGSISSSTIPCQPPRSSDNVYFTAAAFPSAGANVSITGPSACKNMIWDNSIASNPTFSGNFTYELRIFGNLQLADLANMNFDFRGSLIFLGNGGTLNSKEQILKLRGFEIQLNDGASLTLISPLYLRNRSGGSPANSGGFIDHSSGIFISNGQRITATGLRSTGSNIARAVNIQNSRILLFTSGSGGTQSIFNVTTPAANFFSAGSHIIIEADQSNSLGFFAELRFFNIQYDSITFNTQTPFSQRIYPISNEAIQCNYLHFKEGSEFYNLRARTNTLVCERGVTLNIRENSKLEMETFIGPSGCGNTAVIQSDAQVANGAIIEKLSAGHLILSGVLLKNMLGSTAGSKTYEAQASYDGGGNTNILFSNAAACPTDLYFRPVFSNNWHDEENWFDAGGNPVMVLPSPATNVFFNNMSGSAAVHIDRSTAYCNDLSTLADINAGLSIFFNRRALVVLGHVSLDSKLTTSMQSGGWETLSGAIRLYGTNKQFLSKGAQLNNHIQVASKADYTLGDNFYGQIFAMQKGSMLRTNGIEMNLTAFIMGNREMLASNVYLRAAGWPLLQQVSSTTATYDAATTFYVQNGGLNNAQTFDGIFPNLHLDTDSDLRFIATTIKGNLTIARNANMSFYGGMHTTQIKVERNVIIASGVEVRLASDAASMAYLNIPAYFQVDSALSSVGSCAGTNTIKTFDGQPIPFHVKGSTTLDRCFLQGLNSVTSINALNSADGGSNTNITFTTSLGTTFYWRASSSDPNDFMGDWSDPRHWTTNPLNLVGDNACIPSLADDVVFDGLSHGANNGCSINASAYCRNLLLQTNIIINSPTTNQAIYIAGDLFIGSTANVINYRGFIYMVGSGTQNINTNNVSLHCRELVFDNETGVWNLQSPLTMLATHSNSQSARLRLNSGTLNANGYDLFIHHGFYSETNKTRTFNFSGSTFNIPLNATAYILSGSDRRYPWLITNSATFQLQAGNISAIGTGVANTDIRFTFGDNLTYANLYIKDNRNIQIAGNNCNFNYAQLDCSPRIFADEMVYDSIEFYGNRTYTFDAGTTQILRAPHGTIRSFASSSNFVNLQSNTPNSKAYIYRAYGEQLCVDFLNIRDVYAHRERDISNVPAAYQGTHIVRNFDTGQNCDNVLNSATGEIVRSPGDTVTSIWQFSLGALTTPSYTGASILQVCALGSTPEVPLPCVGSAPYIVRYTWTTGSASGTGIVSSLSSPVMLPVHSSDASITYTLAVSTERCLEESVPQNATITVQNPSLNPLTTITQVSSCLFTNENEWLTLIGSGNKRPILSIMDYTGAGDNTALGNVSTSVDFTPSTQSVNIGGVSTPYLRRFWTITPTTNHAAFVRLYFTQAELNTLAAAPTYMGTYTGTLDPATQIQVVRYASGSVGVGAEQIIPHTVTPLTGAAAAPFSSAAGIVCVEFYVPSFSAFIIVPTQDALLPLELQSFEAHKYSERQALISWKVAEAQHVARYEIERSMDGVRGITIGEVVSRRSAGEDSYEFIDATPRDGYNYYRLRSISDDGTTQLSDWRAVLFGEENNTLQVLPNPTKDGSILRLGAAARIEVRLYNALGQLAFEQRFETASDVFELPLAHLPSGIYSLQVLHIDSNSAQTIQLIKE